MVGGRTHWVLTSNFGGREFVYKLWRPTQQSRAMREAAIHGYLIDCGVRCPVAERASDISPLQTVRFRGEDWLAFVTRRVRCSPPSLCAFEDLGGQLATLHAAPVAGLPHLPTVTFESVFATIPPEIVAYLQTRLRRSVAELATGARLGRLTISHGDATLENVVLDGPRAWLTDFEHLRFAPAGLDVGRVLFSIGARRPTLVKALISGYDREEPSSSDFDLWSAIVCAGLEVASWRLANSDHAPLGGWKAAVDELSAWWSRSMLNLRV